MDSTASAVKDTLLMERSAVLFVRRFVLSRVSYTVYGLLSYPGIPDNNRGFSRIYKCYRGIFVT